jgi:DNA polymerase
MHHVVLAGPTDFAGWRNHARDLACEGVRPDDVTWQVAGADADLFSGIAAPQAAPAARRPAFTVPAAFVDLARSAILHREPARFALLYRLLWRLREQPDLMDLAIDPDVTRAHHLSREVHRDQHKMKAFVRFREVGRERDSRYVAWFEPSHFIVESTAPFFENRFADMQWSILTPDLCAHWDGVQTVFTPGAERQAAPAGDPLEEIWRSYYASIFNPARLKVKAMKSEMPVKYWRNLPEASLIAPLIADARRSEQRMIAEAPTAPLAVPQKKEPVMSAAHPAPGLAALREAAKACRACDLWRDATQTVFGEGPARAPVMMVGEQPGDKEDLAGHPFVGPAGQMLDRALAEADVDRGKVYVTNAVKHFKFVPRGKVRLHQKPNGPEIKACRQWYEKERAAVRPGLIVAMGATAVQSVFGKALPIGKNRGKVLELDDGTRALITVHPSYLLRLPDAEAKAREYRNFVEDLRQVHDFLRHHGAGHHAGEHAA